MLERARSFLSRLFPPELAAYIPGSKLVAGLILFVATAAMGISGDQVMTLPIVGEVNVAEVAIAIGFYLYPPAD